MVLHGVKDYAPNGVADMVQFNLVKYVYKCTLDKEEMDYVHCITVYVLLYPYKPPA